MRARRKSPLLLLIAQPILSCYPARGDWARLSPCLMGVAFDKHPPSYPLHAVYGLADRLPLVPAAQRRGSKRFRQAFFKRPRSLSFMIPSAFRNFAIPAKFQPMAPLHGAGPLRRSEGVSKICPARSEAEKQRVQIFSPNGTAAVFRFLFGGKKEQSSTPGRI